MVNGFAARRKNHEKVFNYSFEPCIERVDVCVYRLSVARSEIIGDCRIYSDAETYADGIRKILKRINDGYGRHGVFADLCDEKTVYDIIQRIDEH